MKNELDNHAIFDFQETSHLISSVLKEMYNGSSQFLVLLVLREREKGWRDVEGEGEGEIEIER